MAEELQFTHLHVHTEYSLNDAMCKLGELVKRTKELGMTAIASTDHGNMFSLPRFYLEAKKAGIKPILGCEAYVCPEGQDFRPGDNESEVEEGDGNKRDRHNRHVVLLAKNYTGYQNLIQIISDAVLDGFYYAPRTDLQKLAKWSDGLICLTACLGGDVPFDIMHHGESAAERKLHQYLDIFGEGNVFLEIQDNGIEEQYELNRRLIALSEKTGVPLIATNDVHYIEPKGADYHDVLMAIQAKTTIYSDRRKKYGTKELYLKSPEQMYASGLPREAMENTMRVAEMCNVELPMDKFYVPEYDYPAGFSSSEEFLRHLAYKGLRERYPDFEAREKELTERLEYELSVVKRMGYNDYFLIVWDYVNYALSIGAIPSPGRGSGAGSILAYCLYITHVDPIRHNLIFERKNRKRSLNRVNLGESPDRITPSQAA